MQAKISANEIERLVALDIEACQTLLALLDEEQLALKERDADKLAGIIDKKAVPLDRLEQSAKLRTQWSQADKPGKTPEAWNGMIETLANTSIKQRWEELKTLSRQCQEKNEVNGKILVRNQQVFGRLLELIRGQTAAPNLYDAIGKSKASHYSQKVGEA